jgi:ribosomal protein S18 acetylase RimI-like enzyme
MFFADAAAVEKVSSNAQVTILDGSESSIENAAKFMVDAFWLQSPLLLEDSEVSENGSSAENVQGLVTIEVRLFDKQREILSANASEKMLTQAVASLGPKQRREYKDASVIDIANQLLPPDIIAVCSLSNLCVSPSARRMGIAGKLCNEAERLAKEELGFEEMYLRVEAGNEAAKRLYEEKLGYECVSEVDSSTALRVDAKSGSFVEVESDIVVLKKKI